MASSDWSRRSFLKTAGLLGGSSLLAPLAKGESSTKASQTRRQKIILDVETHGELTVGKTVVDTRPRSAKDPNAYVALDADEPLFVKMLLETMGRTA